MTWPRALDLTGPHGGRLVLAGAALVVLVAAAASAFVHPVVGVLLVVALLVAPIVLSSRPLALTVVVAVVVLLPFAAIPLGIGFNPTLLDLALAAVYLIWIVRLVTRADTDSALASPLAVVMLLFVGLAVTAFLAGFGQGTPTKNQMRTFAELVLATGLLVVVPDLVRDRTTLRRVFLAVVGLGTLAALVGLALYALPDDLQMRLLSLLRFADYPTGPGVLRYLNDDPSRLQRATGTSIDPNAFGGLLAVVAAFLLPQVVSRTPWLPRRLAVVMMGILTLALLLTVSRAALLGLVAAAALVALARDRRLLLAGAVVGLVALATAAVLPWTAAYVDHFVQGLAGADRATQMRFGEYKDAFRLIQRYPLLGVGFGDVRDADLYRGVSSLYLIVASSMGLVGLTAFVALLAAVGVQLGRAWRRLRDGAGEGALVLGSLAALTAVAVSGVLDHYFFTYPHELALLWLVLGLGLAAARHEPAAVAGEPAESPTLIR